MFHYSYVCRSSSSNSMVPCFYFWSRDFVRIVYVLNRSTFVFVYISGSQIPPAMVQSRCKKLSKYSCKRLKRELRNHIIRELHSSQRKSTMYQSISQSCTTEGHSAAYVYSCTFLSTHASASAPAHTHTHAYTQIRLYMYTVTHRLMGGNRAEDSFGAETSRSICRKAARACITLAPARMRTSGGYFGSSGERRSRRVAWGHLLLLASLPPQTAPAAATNHCHNHQLLLSPALQMHSWRSLQGRERSSAGRNPASVFRSFSQGCQSRSHSNRGNTAFENITHPIQ